MHAGIVGADDDKAAIDAVVGSREDRIGRNVQADMLHGAQASHTGNGCSVRDFRRDFFVGRPLAVKILLILRQGFKDFGTGGSRVSRTDPDARLIGTAGNGFIAGQQVFHGSPP